MRRMIGRIRRALRTDRAIGGIVLALGVGLAALAAESIGTATSRPDPWAVTRGFLLGGATVALISAYAAVERGLLVIGRNARRILGACVLVLLVTDVVLSSSRFLRDERPGARVCGSVDCYVTAGSTFVVLGIAIAAVGGAWFLASPAPYLRRLRATSTSTGEPCRTWLVLLPDSDAADFVAACDCGWLGPDPTSRAEAIADARAHLPNGDPVVIDVDGDERVRFTLPPPHRVSVMAVAIGAFGGAASAIWATTTIA